VTGGALPGHGFASAEAFVAAGGLAAGSNRSTLRSASPDLTERGATAIGSGSTSLLLALLAAASSAGSWCAVVGVPTLGALAAAESGIALDRLALVPNPGPEWPTVVAALIDGVDVVVIAVPGQVSASIASRLVARARQRGCVLVPYGRWDGADVTLQVTQGRWEGLGAGHGRLRRRKVTVIARGRGTAARPKEITMWMPGLAVAPPRDPAPGTTEPLHDPASGSPHDPAPATPEPPRFRPVAVPPPASTAIAEEPVVEELVVEELVVEKPVVEELVAADPGSSRFRPLAVPPVVSGAGGSAAVFELPSPQPVVVSASASGADEDRPVSGSSEELASVSSITMRAAAVRAEAAADPAGGPAASALPGLSAGGGGAGAGCA
jgi:hypothetical protein